MKNKFKKIKNYVLGAAVLFFFNLKYARSQSITIKNPLSNAQSIDQLIGAILEALLKLGAAVVVFMIIYSGFLFVQAQGNEDKLKKAKNTFLWTVIGGVILLSARVLAAVVQNTATGLGL